LIVGFGHKINQPARQSDNLTLEHWVSVFCIVQTMQTGQFARNNSFAGELQTSFLHDHSPNNPEKTNNPTPPMTTWANDKKTGPIPNAKPNPPTANNNNIPKQSKPNKILCIMINP
jgi:hypothetical protein